MTLLTVRVQPRASRNEVGELLPDGTLKVRVTAPPADGKANDAVIKLLAKHLGVPPSDLSIMHGATSRNKVLDVSSLSEVELRQKL